MSEIVAPMKVMSESLLILMTIASWFDLKYPIKVAKVEVKRIRASSSS